MIPFATTSSFIYGILIYLLPFANSLLLLLLPLLTMDPNIDIDIFRDLDASFMEIFHRTQLQRYLEHLPPEREQQLNNIMAQGDLYLSQQQQPRYYHVHWIFSHIPFIILNFDQM